MRNFIPDIFVIPLLSFFPLSTFLTCEFGVSVVVGVGQAVQCQSIGVHSKHQSTLVIIEMPISSAQVFLEICGFHPIYGTSTQQSGSPV